MLFVRTKNMKLFCCLLVLSAIANFAYGRDHLIDFSQKGEDRNWIITNDSVMGGVSQSKIEIFDSTLEFSGSLRLENNGGFVSTYRPINDGTIKSNQTIALKVLGDGRRYQFRLRTNNAGPVAYSATFQTEKDRWLLIELNSRDFKAVFRGRRVIDAPNLDYANANRVGFMLADKQPGAFRLTIDSIKLK